MYLGNLQTLVLVGASIAVHSSNNIFTAIFFTLYTVDAIAKLKKDSLNIDTSLLLIFVPINGPPNFTLTGTTAPCYWDFSALLLVENTELRERLSAAHRGTSAAHWENLSQASKTAVFGSAIIRDIDEGKLLNTTCICIPGGKITDIKEAVKKFPTTTKLSRAVLVVGGNDCDDRDKQTVEINDLVNEYSDLIVCTKEIASSVCVSSVCPRARSPQVEERIGGLNAALSVLCGDHAVEFVNNDPSFYLQDGNVNDGYLLPDGVHLSRAATNKLVTNIKLPLRHGEATAHVDHRRRGANPPPPPPPPR